MRQKALLALLAASAAPTHADATEPRGDMHVSLNVPGRCNVSDRASRSAVIAQQAAVRIECAPGAPFSAIVSVERRAADGTWHEVKAGDVRAEALANGDAAIRVSLTY